MRRILGPDVDCFRRTRNRPAVSRGDLFVVHPHRADVLRPVFGPALALVAVLLLPFLGCDFAGASATATPDASVPDGSSPVDGASSNAYPAGPYGFKVGEVIPDVAFTDRSGSPVSLGELRGRPGVRVLLWSSGAEWCTVCKGEVPKLEMLQEQKSGEGLLIFESLHESFDRRPADQNTLARWDQMFDVNYLLLFEKSPPHEPRVNNPVVWAINARTMKILSRENYTQMDVVAAVNAALAASR